MIVFRYDVEAPFLTWATVGADGTVTQPPVAVDGVDEGYMIHDFAITQRYVVLVVGPLQFDVDAMLSGGQPLAWKPELGTRIAVDPARPPGPDPLGAHRRVLGLALRQRLRGRWTRPPRLARGRRAPAMLLPPAERTAVTGSFARATIDPARGTIDVHHLDVNVLEFPRIDDRLIGAQHRYVTVAGRSADPAVKPGEHDELHRYDMDAGTSVRYDAHAALGEPVFAPARRRQRRARRLLPRLRHATSTTGDTSLLVFDADTFPAPPAGHVHIPRRVPNGLHGNWFPAR